MKIEVLELRKYGPFTGLKLDLSQGAHGLHVVFGHNEAGKSSALRGLTASLYGIESRTTDDFVHAYTDMRLAMTLRNALGDRLSFVRRKASKHALRDSTDAAVMPDDALQPYLSRVDSEEFERVFGIDHVRLREGSRQLLAASDGADAAIVGTTLGVNDLRKVRNAIDEEAKSLFTPRASKPKINAAVSDWKRRQAEMRQREIGPSAYQTARYEAERLGQARDEAKARLEELRQTQRALELAKRNLGSVTELDGLREQMAALTSVPDLAEDFDQRRQNAQDRLDRAKKSHDQHEKELADLRMELQKMPVEFSLLSHVAEVEELRTLNIEVQKAASDRERRLGEAQSESKERDRRARELGLELPVERGAADELRLSLAARDRCEELVRDFTKLQTELAGATNSRTDLELKKQSCDGRCAAAKPPADHAMLKQKVRFAHQLGDIDGKLASLAVELTEADRHLVEGLRQLPGFTGTVEALAEGRVPGPATIEDFARRYRELDDDVRRIRGQQLLLQGQRDRLAAEVTRIVAGGMVPSEEELAASRDRRQKQWRLVRRAWMEGAEVEEQARAIDLERPLADAFAHSMERSDSLADQMRRESDRVAQLDEKRRQLRDLDRDLEEAGAAAGYEVTKRRELDADWARAWEASGLSLGNVSAMNDAMSTRQRVLELATNRRKVMESLADGTQRREAARTALLEALVAAGFSGASGAPDSTLAPELSWAEAKQDELEQLAREQQGNAAEQQRLRHELDQNAAQMNHLAHSLDVWKSAFAAATRGMPGRPDEQPDSVLRVLDRIKAFVEKVDKVEEIKERIRKIDADAAELRRRCSQFRRANMPQLAEEEPGAFVARLVRLVETGKQDKFAFDTNTKELQRLRTAVRQADVEHQSASRILQQLAEEAGAESTEDLRQFVRRADEKRRLRKESERLETYLLREDLPLEELERRVRSCQGRDLDAELGKLSSEVETSQGMAEQHVKDAEIANGRVEELNKQSGAAEIAAEMAGIAAQVRSDVERYVRLAAASRMLGVAVEHFRNKHETPLLRHASVHFAGLTCGRYDQIETDVDDDGKPFFQVRETATQTTKKLGALSDGTRDQLHLALVLGSLAHRFEGGREPMPLVLDDVLVHFDDERSLAALRVLAEFSAVTQVVLFTHHTRIRDQATSLAPAGTVFVHELCSPTAALASP